MLVLVVVGGGGSAVADEEDQQLVLVTAGPPSPSDSGLRRTLCGDATDDCDVADKLLIRSLDEMEFAVRFGGGGDEDGGGGDDDGDWDVTLPSRRFAVPGTESNELLNVNLMTCDVGDKRSVGQ